ncbi:hypothetical protein [Thiomonas bhubaneswarensis]|uniref:Nucleotidyltransferase domain n=1 Tax=Thiomonas bhubaneswarensis TaxID=339866 RepID=A0A0K6I3U6_9BURK|nr:hypothetical protein [Thiomonas bhubaneswarensis]CUA97751.1 hypothetical protein Ga0061069_10675 [Thiomonas bhubaneswarensis]
MDTLRAELAVLAARLIVEDGLDYGTAKRKAAKRLLGQRVAHDLLPSNDEIEQQVREELALFHAETQPLQLQQLRRAALTLMEEFAAFNPHLAGAVWHGTANEHSDLHVLLFTDDTKGVEIHCIDRGFDVQVGEAPHYAGRGRVEQLTLDWPPHRREAFVAHLSLYPEKDIRGALLPDAQGRTPRGSLAAVRHILQQPEAPADNPSP